MNPPVANLPIWKVTPDGIEAADDLIAREEPLALELGYSTPHGRERRELAITMRTPGEDLHLALGFLLSEGIIHTASDVSSIRHCDQSATPESTGNLVQIELTDACRPPVHVFKRHSFITSSCGVCGKASIDALRLHQHSGSLNTAHAPSWSVSAKTLHSLPSSLVQKQRVFGATGGLHAAGLFNTDGDLLSLHEDVGRHNALDKLIGAALARGDLPLNRHILLLSGRASFELLQKASIAGINLVCAVGAPSSLAVACANEFGVTLLGFLRQERFNVYSHPRRVRELETIEATFSPQARHGFASTPYDEDHLNPHPAVLCPSTPPKSSTFGPDHP